MSTSEGAAAAVGGQVVAEVRLAGVPLVMVEDAQTEHEDGTPQSLRGWATDSGGAVVASTLSTSQVPDLRDLVRDEAAGAAMVRGMERGSERAQLQEDVRAARAGEVRDTDDALRLDGVPVAGVVVDAAGVHVAGAVVGATVLVVTASGCADLSLGPVDAGGALSLR